VLRRVRVTGVRAGGVLPGRVALFDTFPIGRVKKVKANSMEIEPAAM